jgi:hypothetical protein
LGVGGRGEACTGFWWGKLRRKDHLGDPGIDGRIILRWICKKWDVGVLTGWNWLRIGTGGECCECSDKLSGSINVGNFLTGCKLGSFSRRTLLHGVSK